MKIKLLILALCFIFSSCEEDDTSVVNVETFLVEVDNFVISDVTETTIPIAIDFYGIIGTDGCHRFSHFETSFEGNDIFIKCFGMRRIDQNIVCTDNIVELGGERLLLNINQAGQYFIKVLQPDASVYEQELVVN